MYSKFQKRFPVKKRLLLLTRAFWLRVIRDTFFIRELFYSCVILYPRYPKLLFFDCFKFLYCLRHNPYDLLKRSAYSSLLIHGNVYGETPWSALNKICREFGITSKETIYDLGCGLGKVCFWFGHVIGATAVGIDNQEAFINKAAQLQKFSKNPALCMQGSFDSIDLTEVSYIYFYGSSYSLRILGNVIRNLNNLPLGAVVISISFPLDSLSYGKETFYTEQSCKVFFPWGQTTAYKNIRKNI
ncbi:histone methylation DOT1 family protein [Chlamydia ibidis]|uniref:Histone methylation DOT1 family protein n=1 Tax=Chlamydia ibidis TaxID=1405396 RepID=S7KE29_9CHLA|nr:histone methylation DOT1 family protein [Chlamydia ibidis]